jgi:hypothetical protein
MNKSKARWSDQHLTQLRSQIEAFKHVIQTKGMPKKEEGQEPTLDPEKIADQRSQVHEKAMESYREKFEDYDLDYTRLAGKHLYYNFP